MFYFRCIGGVGSRASGRKEYTLKNPITPNNQIDADDQKRNATSRPSCRMRIDNETVSFSRIVASLNKTLNQPTRNRTKSVDDEQNAKQAHSKLRKRQKRMRGHRWFVISLLRCLILGRRSVW
ncbi:hypothetical protein K227x_01200 [Rubripirellula lacrimiformis]|uniref:Uncharacterized protein n=1 Tax=Rubripirellula lacrimiformis TaxID=1930273 RepID=A0A517N3P0_9BACT|nr:hypothetical protein K227x_01200 [Rubripirellula lacrimiformis]